LACLVAMKDGNIEGKGRLLKLVMHFCFVVQRKNILLRDPRRSKDLSRWSIRTRRFDDIRSSVNLQSFDDKKIL